jgi:hypothetical protein
MILNMDLGFGTTIIRTNTCKDYSATIHGKKGVCDSCYNCAFIGSIREEEYAKEHLGWIKGIIKPKAPNRFEHVDIIIPSEAKSKPVTEKKTCKVGARSRFADIDLIME